MLNNMSKDEKKKYFIENPIIKSNEHQIEKKTELIKILSDLYELEKFDNRNGDQAKNVKHDIPKKYNRRNNER